MKLKLKDIISTLIGWSIIQGVILSGSMILWNWVMPSVNVPKINFLQIIILYILYKLFCYDWVEQYNKNSKSHLNKESNEPE